MTGQTDLRQLLADMSAELRSGRYVFTTVAEIPEGLDPVATVREPEGTTLVLEEDEAQRSGLGYEYVAAMITLRVHSSLDAIGLTAAVAQALTDRGISCNVVAGYFHDHLFVPVDRGPEAVNVLREPARRAQGPARR